MKKVLVICTGNSCRSQMAQGYLQYFANQTAIIYSAGIETHGLHPNAIKFMKEDGIDISQHTSNNIQEYKGVDFDFVITVCDHAKETCPYFPTNAKIIHHNFLDPTKVIGTEEEIAIAFRKTRNEIKRFCELFASKYLLR